MIDAFLASVGWADALISPLAGDASARAYSRLQRGGTSAILMQDPTGDVGRFASLSRHLIDLGLSAPQILAEDFATGLLLIEDLGDGLFARLTAVDPARETPLYLAAADTLLSLHRHAPPPLDKATPDHLAQMTDLAFDCYLAAAAGAAAPQDKADCRAAMADALNTYAPDTDVMILRDFHAENLLWLPDRVGAARTGLLDFQDALQGHRAYDLASLLTDVRRDVTPATCQAVIRHYVDQSGLPDTPFRAALAVLGAQRNLRILGVFARLAANGKPRYLELMPRVWSHLQRDLAHPALGRIAATLHPVMPPPDPEIIARLRQTCPMQ
ncbi:aminoglycoside phosphotransferase family protein [Puniceibacterium confluentis]|uniref:aminoglycoside phosphotransferase family protein n=1 Tax=Puniceibacterium confluentis TaxID=1958944 RepID=UPI003569CBF7